MDVPNRFLLVPVKPQPSIDLISRNKPIVASTIRADQHITLRPRSFLITYCNRIRIAAGQFIFTDDLLSVGPDDCTIWKGLLNALQIVGVMNQKFTILVRKGMTERRL